jgi:Right handed beta helix region
MPKNHVASHGRSPGSVRHVARHAFRHRDWRLLAVILVALSVTAASWAVSWSSARRTVAPIATLHVTCHNSSTDAARLQQAIDSSPVGAAIQFQGGTCLLTRGLTLPGNRTYMGGSTTGTVLRQAGPAAYVLASSAYAGNVTSTGDPLAIRDLTVACDGSGGTDGIILMNWQVDVEHVNVSDCGGSGIVDTNTNAAGRPIVNTSVNSRFDNNFITGSGRYGFEVHYTGNSVTDGFLDDNQIADSRLDAIHLENAAGWVISGNHLYNVGENAIIANRLYGTTISDNYIEDFAAGQQSGTWYGISGTVQNGHGSTILGNKVFNHRNERPGATHVYIGITQTNNGAGHLAVTGNVIMGSQPSDIGIFLSGGQNQLDVAMSGNQVSGVGTAHVTESHATVNGGS